jgi:hypothetical protein
MGSHDPFGHLKHKLWPKEGLRVKFAIWLLTTKSCELPQFPYVQVACHIPLESSRRRIQFFFDLTSIGGLHTKLWAPKVTRVPTLGSRSPETKCHWMLAPWPGTKYTIRGKVVASPKFEPWWILWIRVYPRLIRAPKVF